MRRLTVVIILLTTLAFAAEVHLPAPSARPAISYDMGFGMILQAMAFDHNILHNAQLSSPDELTAVKIIADFELRFQALSAALDRRVLAPEQFGDERDQLIRIIRANLRATLSRVGSLRLETYIRTQIAHIRVNGVQPTEN